jgi:DtxR family Mn-dependent transcriptional regulator
LTLNFGLPKFDFRKSKMHSQAVEDYLKTIYEIEREQDKVATTVLAEQLGVAPASATGMIKKLAEMDLVAYEPYQGVVLTQAGRKIAVEIIRHHRLIELFLAETLDVPWDQVHAEAHKIEHVLSEDLVERIDVALGRPTTDPHGAPIPTREGTIDQPLCQRLADLEPRQSGVITEVFDNNAALLRYLGELGLYPKVGVYVISVAPFDGPITLRVGETLHTLGREVANQILVTDVHVDER